jgi:hypothetical protein
VNCQDERTSFHSPLFIARGTATGQRTSLGTIDEEEAQQIVAAENQALRQPVLNLRIARAYLAGTDSGIDTRTWRQAMTALTDTKQENYLRPIELVLFSRS